MKKKSQSEKNSPLDISDFDTLNERIDINTNCIKSLESQVSIMLKKMNCIEELIKQSFTNEMPEQDSEHDSSKDTDSDSETKDKPIINRHVKIKKPSEQVIKKVEHTSDSESEEDFEDQIILPPKKITKPESNKSITKKPINQNKAIIKPTAQKVQKPNNPITANRGQTSPRSKIQVKYAKNKGTNNEEEDQNNEIETNIQEELSKSKKLIITMNKSISESINYMNQTYICENLNAMKCFKKIKWNTKNSENNENSLEPFTKNGCKYHIYAEDMQNKKFYFQLSDFRNNPIEKPTKLNNEKESFIYATVRDSLKMPQIRYYLLINKNPFTIRYNEKQSFVKTIYEMKVQNNVIRSKGPDYDYDKDINDDEIIEEEEEDNDDEKQGILTKSTIFRKIKKIRNPNQNQDENDENDIDFEKELSKSILRIKKMEKNIEFNTGYMGEAYVFEDLKEMNCFPEVVWNAKTSDSKNPSVYIKDGKYFHIKEDYGHFDIYATDKYNKKYYFEIKSSIREKARGLRKAQKNMSIHINQRKESFILCKVTNVLDNPLINYFLVINQVNYQINLNKGKSFVEMVEELKIINNCYGENENVDEINILNDSSDEESENDVDDSDFYHLSTRNVKKLKK